MKVYIVVEYSGDNASVKKVFSSLAKADIYVEAHKYPLWFDVKINIEEYEIDQ